MSNSLKDQYATSPLFGGNAAAIEALYEKFIENPDGVSAGWRRYFRTLGDVQGEIPHTPIRERLLARSRSTSGNGHAAPVVAGATATANEKQAAVSRLIQVYSLRGHQIADLDPLGLQAGKTGGYMGPFPFKGPFRGPLPSRETCNEDCNRVHKRCNFDRGAAAAACTITCGYACNLATGGGGVFHCGPACVLVCAPVVHRRLQCLDDLRKCLIRCQDCPR